MNQKRRKNKAADSARGKDDLAELKEEFRHSQDCYVKQWAVDESCFAEQGHYGWMASFLAGRGRILEVGTGEGSGTLALCKNNTVVVSVEHNPICLKRAELKLADGGIPVLTEPREPTMRTMGNWVVQDYGRPNSSPPTQGALLLGGEILEPELQQWLKSIGPFDAIACWNIGTHLVMHKVAGGVAEYRRTVQKSVYELADEILRPGGVLHIIDRYRLPSAEDRDKEEAKLVSAHQDEASVTSLIVDADSLRIRPYDPPPAGKGMPMMHDGATGTPTGTVVMALLSILVRKP